MSDIHQEWHELRKKNGDFICHLDEEMAKLEKKQVELKHRERLQNLADAGAFAMQFAVPFNCCQDDCDILKALNKAQADRIETLEKEIIARKEQAQIDLAVKKDLDEKLDKATADYRALWVENDNLNRALARLQSQLDGAKAQCENTVENRQRISELSKEVIDLRERLASTKEELAGFISMYDKAADEAHQAKVAKDRMGYSNSCMQSKIAKQAAEIKRLTEENEDLKGTTKTVQKMMDANLEDIHKLRDENKQLHKALDIAAKDADANFERGKIKGMQEIWKELVDCYDGRPIGENEKIFGYHTVGDMLMNLSPTWFMNRAREYHEQKEKEARDIKLGDEVEIFDQFDHSLSDTGIVIAIDKDHPCFAVISPRFEGCFAETDIQAGNVRKTGQHFDSIPLDYFA